MISKKEIICPENLISLAKSKGPVKAVIVNAVKLTAIESAKQAVDANLITPIFIGEKSIIEKNAKEIVYQINKTASLVTTVGGVKIVHFLLMMMTMTFGLDLNKNIFYGILLKIYHLAFQKKVSLHLKDNTIVVLELKLHLEEK